MDDEGAAAKVRASIVRSAFARQARAFARSPLQTDPGRLRRLIRFLDPRPGERALDVACGPGIVTAALAEAGLLAFGVDLTREMMRESVAAEGRFVQADVGRLPFPDATFDVAVCRSSFHHFGEPLEVMRQMARVVRPGGRVVVEDMRAPDDEDKRAYHETVERLRDVSHARTLTRGEFLEVVTKSGLRDIEDERATLVIDFDEWIDRACPSPENREKARLLMEACIADDRCGLRVWKEAGRLRFERQSLLVRATRPGR